jgi:hypothetical protein
MLNTIGPPMSTMKPIDPRRGEQHRRADLARRDIRTPRVRLRQIVRDRRTATITRTATGTAPAHLVGGGGTQDLVQLPLHGPASRSASFTSSMRLPRAIVAVTRGCTARRTRARAGPQQSARPA